MGLRVNTWNSAREEITESGVRVKRTEEKEKRADRSAGAPGGDCRQSEADDGAERPAARRCRWQKLKAIHGKVRKAVHESASGIPESNGVAGQLLLLCGLAAYWGALGREASLARRSHINRTGGTRPGAKWCRKKYYRACLRRCGAGDCGDSCFCLALYLRHHRHL